MTGRPTTSQCIDFDPDQDGFDVPLVYKLINGDAAKSGLQSLVNPHTVMDFLLEVMSNDFIIAIDGKLSMSMPLSDWSKSLFRELDITIGTASAMFRNAKVRKDSIVGTVAAFHSGHHSRFARMNTDEG